MTDQLLELRRILSDQPDEIEFCAICGFEIWRRAGIDNTIREAARANEKWRHDYASAPSPWNQALFRGHDIQKNKPGILRR